MAIFMWNVFFIPRQLIFTEPDIIATPCLDEENKVLVIMQVSRFNLPRGARGYNRSTIS